MLVRAPVALSASSTVLVCRLVMTEEVKDGCAADDDQDAQCHYDPNECWREGEELVSLRTHKPKKKQVPTALRAIDFRDLTCPKVHRPACGAIGERSRWS